jgi:GT2 family glycosyltransferase
LFLDDDVVFGKELIEELISAYNTNPRVLGVQGYREDEIVRSKWFWVGNLFNRMFYLFYRSPDRCIVLPSFNQSYPYPLTKPIQCQWMTSCCCSYAKEVFDAGFRFDELLIEYSVGEDIDLSYRVYKNHPGSLLITPQMKYIHKESQLARPPRARLMYMKALYLRYLYYKNMNNVIIYNWSRIGATCLTCLSLVRTQLQLSERIGLIVSVCKAEVFSFRVRSDLKVGQLSKYYHILDEAELGS